MNNRCSKFRESEKLRSRVLMKQTARSIQQQFMRVQWSTGTPPATRSGLFRHFIGMTGTNGRNHVWLHSLTFQTADCTYVGTYITIPYTGSAGREANARVGGQTIEKAPRMEALQIVIASMIRHLSERQSAFYTSIFIVNPLPYDLPYGISN
ncbi:uncharacterized protein LOC143213280 isoform X1 [Lasioglossum baleicum]|uniref:uncharacterized protein LOC143213280 isoform X1 n=1 Tax=Lasioglossum baleicum TaxID=434251 RepID=UPI003FCEAD6A